MAHRTTQSVEFEIIFYKDKIYMIQGNFIFAVLSFRDKILTTDKDKKPTDTVVEEGNLSAKQGETNKTKTYLSLEAANCVAQIVKLDPFKSSHFRSGNSSVNHCYLLDLIDELKSNENEFKHECSICYEEIKELKILDCHHYFCESCIGNWTKFNSTCPVCRAPVE